MFAVVFDELEVRYCHTHFTIVNVLTFFGYHWNCVPDAFGIVGLP